MDKLISVTIISTTHDQLNFYNVVGVNVTDDIKGSVGILYNHIPMLLIINNAKLCLRFANEQKTFFISNGLVDVNYTKISVVVKTLIEQ